MSLLNPDIWKVWNSLAAEYSGDDALVSILYEDLVNYYNEPHRYYHNLEHIQALIRLYQQYKDRLEKKNVVLFSIFYHDVIYTPGKGENEEQSALVAKTALEQLQVPAGAIEEVQVYIRATKVHHLSPTASIDLKYFIDFDLSILAADPERYKAYLLQVRKEYGHLSNEHFVWGRKAFLKNMLSQEHIFYTEDFRAEEEAARKNMQWEMEMGPGLFSAD